MSKEPTGLEGISRDVSRAAGMRWVTVATADIRSLLADHERLGGAVDELLACLKDIDWDESGTPTAWPNRERVDAAIAKAAGGERDAR